MAAAAVISSLLVWGGVRYGPFSRQAQEAPPPPPPQRPAATRDAGVARRADYMPADAPAPASAFEPIFKEAVRGGRVEASASAFADRLEEQYRRRGYVRRGRVGGRRGPLLPDKTYWRGALPGGQLIVANGADADPHSETVLERPDLFVTAVEDEAPGGAGWSTFRRGDLERLAGGGDPQGDFPGGDPPLVPRAEGLRRVLSFPRAAAGGSGFLALYESARPARELADWYVAEMSRGWRYDPDLTAQARSVAEGTFCFTQPTRFCLVWVTPEADGRTTLIVSLHNH